MQTRQPTRTLETHISFSLNYKMRPPKFLPLEIWNLIFFEFNPSPLQEYLLTSLNNHYAVSFQHYIYPTCKYAPIFKSAGSMTLLMFLFRLRTYYAPLKRYKSRRYLSQVSYEDFPLIEKLITSHTYSLFFSNIKPTCLNQLIRN